MKKQKKCTRCKKTKPLDKFRLRSNTKLKHSWCRVCEKQYSKEWDYKRKIDLKKFVFNYLLSSKCITCGTTDVLVLEFDHKDPTTKSFNVSRAVAGKDKVFTLQQVKDEVAKCEVMCRNCHQRRTHEQTDTWRWQMVKENS